MAFFQPKKEHKDKPFLFQINTNLSDCGTEPGFDNKGTIYLLDVTYKGTAEYVAFTFDDGKPFTFSNGNKVTLKASEALYSKMSEANVEKDDYVQINLTDWVDPKGVRKTVWNVDKQDAATVPSVVNNVQNGSGSVNIPIVDDRDMQIKWGMCLKEATNLSIAICADEEEPNYLQTIDYFTFKLMDIAVDGFKRWENEHHQKDQNSDIDDLF